MSSSLPMSYHEVALELVKIEKAKPTTKTQNTDAITLFEEYISKVITSCEKARD